MPPAVTQEGDGGPTHAKSWAIVAMQLCCCRRAGAGCWACHRMNHDNALHGAFHVLVQGLSRYVEQLQQYLFTAQEAAG